MKSRPENLDLLIQQFEQELEMTRTAKNSKKFKKAQESKKSRNSEQAEKVQMSKEKITPLEVA